MARYQGDPRFIEVRRNGACAKPSCHNEIRVGERAFYYPQSGSLYGSHCGHAEEAYVDFRAHQQDEDGY